MAKKHGPATQMGLRQAEINKKNLQGKVPEVAPMIDLGGDKVDIGFNSNEMEDPMLMRHLKGVPKQPSVQDIIEEIGDNFEYIELLANATPYGMMVPYSLPTEPIDWVFCNGQACPESPLRDQLIAAGNPFGTVGGVPAVPNLSGRTIVGNTAMGNVQQPALPNATALNTTLGTTNGLFTIRSAEAPQREFNIGTTDNGGLLSITIDNSFTGLSVTDGDQADITNDGAKANIKNPGGEDNKTNGAKANITGDKTNSGNAALASAQTNGTINKVSGTTVTVLGSGSQSTTGGKHSHRIPNVGSSTGFYRATNANAHTGEPDSDRNWHGQTHGNVHRSVTQDYNCTRTIQGEHTPRLFRNDRPYGYEDGQWRADNESPEHSHTIPEHGHTTNSHTHNVYDTGHSHTISQADHTHTITQTDHTHTITQNDHTHGITDVQHNHVAHAEGTIPGSDFEFDLTQPGLVVNFIIFHGQHLPEDTEPVVRHNELAPIVEELEAATKANADLIQQNMAMMKQLEAKING